MSPTDQPAGPLAEVLAWLHTLEPTTRARYLTVLLDTRSSAVLSAERVAAVYEATRTRSYAEVAAEVGVSTHAINHAVTRHRAGQANTH